MSVAVVAIVRPSGLSASGSGPADRLASVAIERASTSLAGLRAGSPCRAIRSANGSVALTARPTVLPFRHPRVIDYIDSARGSHCPRPRASSATVRRADRRRVSRPPGRPGRGRHPGPRQLGADRRPPRPAGRDPDRAGHARAVRRPPRRRVLPRDRPADPRLHEHRPGGDQHRRRDGHRLRRFDRRRAADRLAAHVHARRTACSRSSSDATSPTTRGSSSRSSRSGGSRRASTSCRSSCTGPGTRWSPAGPGRSCSTCRWTSRPRRPRSSSPTPPSARRAAGSGRPPTTSSGRRRSCATRAGRSSSPAAARSPPRRRPRSRPSPSGSGRRS